MNKPGASLAKRERIEKALSYTFKDVRYLKRALTHRSALPHQHADENETYQRLEFMGDRVLALVIADMLYKAFPDADEGELARRLTGLVRNETCASVAEDCQLANHIIMSDGEHRAGGRQKAAILGDVCEAVLAAIYFDGGLDEARAFIERNWRERMENWNIPLRDAKTALQEWAHGRKLETPIYREVSRSGPDHALRFVTEVSVKGLEPSQGEGTSKRESQQKAASSFLIREGVWENDPHGN